MTESEVIPKASSPSILCHESNNLTYYLPFRTLFQKIKISSVPPNPQAFFPYPLARRAARGALGAFCLSRKQAENAEMTGPALAASASPSGACARSDDGAERDLSLRAAGAPPGGKGSHGARAAYLVYKRVYYNYRIVTGVLLTPRRGTHGTDKV